MRKKQTKLFKQYKAEIQRLLTLAQIGGDWSIIYEEEDEGDDEYLAAVDWNMIGRWVRFAFNSQQHHLLGACPLKSARHEFGHFVVAKLDELAKRRCVTMLEIYEANEEIARIFETILTKKDK